MTSGPPSKRQKPVKAYENPAFMDSRAARPLRILSEYIEPRARLEAAGIQDTIVFFGSARIPSPEVAEAELTALEEKASTSEQDLARAKARRHLSVYYDAARALSARLSQWSREICAERGQDGHRFTIVTGGGPGIMEAANRGATEAGGTTLGMNISLPFEQYPNEFIPDGLAFEFHYFFMRKFWLVYLAKAAVIMPGGFGTLDEFTEILTLIQTQKIRRKMPIVLFGTDYWNRVLNFEPMAELGTINPDDLSLFHITDSVDAAFDWLRQELMQWAIDHPGGTIKP